MGKHIFGPVPSRRLGISLGVDLVKAKTCNLDCVFCECGKTDSWTSTRGSFVPYEEVIEELDLALQEITPDYITFSGSGEPTLSQDLERVIDYIHSHHSEIKIAVITNSTLLHLPEVLRSLQKADLVMPSLHSIQEKVFQRIVRPSPEVSIQNIMTGLTALSKHFSGKIDIELFLIEGLNTLEEDLLLYAKFIKTLSYRKLQLNSLDRPGSESWVQALSYERLQEIQSFLEKQGVKGIEIIGKFQTTTRLCKDTERLEAMQERRQYTEAEIKSLYK